MTIFNAWFVKSKSDNKENEHNEEHSNPSTSGSETESENDEDLAKPCKCEYNGIDCWRCMFMSFMGVFYLLVMCIMIIIVLNLGYVIYVSIKAMIYNENYTSMLYLNKSIIT